MGISMKKVSYIILIALLCLCLSACGAVSECEALIAEIGTLDPNYHFDSTTGYYEIDADGMAAFEKADECYNNLSDSQKSKVSNYDLLESQREAYLTLKEALPYLNMQRTVYAYVKPDMVWEIKSTLKSSGSYEEGVFNGGIDEYNEETGEFEFSAVVSYSATNSFGGRLDEMAILVATGVYNSDDDTVSNIEVERLS